MCLLARLYRNTLQNDYVAKLKNPAIYVDLHNKFVDIYNSNCLFEFLLIYRQSLALKNFPAIAEFGWSLSHLPWSTPSSYALGIALSMTSPRPLVLHVAEQILVINHAKHTALVLKTNVRL